MQKITPFLWFNNNAQEAMKFYTTAFTNSKVGNVSTMMVSFQLEGQEFISLNGGPQFTFTPAVSFFASCTTLEEIDALWQKLSDNGKVLMEFQKYPFSEKYGWCNDKFGVSWQLFLGKSSKHITPLLMFVGGVAGRAEEAMKFYVSVFHWHRGNSSIETVAHYSAGMGEPETSVVHGDFVLADQHFMAMDSSRSHAFGFSEANSFFVNCEGQDEVDYFWEKLSAGGTKGQCGWLKDKYGLSWQIIPNVLGTFLSDPDIAASQRVMRAMLQMTKIDIDVLTKAHQAQ